MGRAWSLGVVLALLGALPAPVWAAGGPVLQRVEMERIRTDTSEYTVEATDSGLVMARVWAPEGVATLTSVTITEPDGEAHTITPDATGNRAWVIESDTVVRAEWRGTLTPSGTYTVTATAGELEDSLTLRPPPYVPTTSVLSLPEEGYATTTVTWTGATDATAGNTLYLYKQPKELSWQYPVPGAVTSVAYNADGLASEAALVPGHTYLWRFESRKPQDAGVTDPRVFTYTRYRYRGRFAVASSTPSVLYASVTRWYNDISESPVWYGLAESLNVAICDLERDIDQVTVTDPEGATHIMEGDASGRYWATYWCADGFAAEPAVAGAYTITVRDLAGHSSTFTTPVIGTPPAIALTSPTPGGTSSEPAPTFTWGSDLDARFRIQFFQDGKLGRLWWHHPAGADVRSNTYNHDGSAVVPELTPGYSYYLSLEAEAGDMEDCADVRVTTRLMSGAWYPFSYPSPGPLLPDLPGRLVYGSSRGYQDDPWFVMQYDPDSSRRTWVGLPAAKDAALSPDGSKLIYSLNGTWIDSLDGSSPTQFGPDTAFTARWSPDGSRIVYVDGVYGRPYAVRTAKVDGSGVRTVAESPSLIDSVAWSPDGAWIAYGEDTGGLWLVRPDRTDNHAMAITGITGYPILEPHLSNGYDWSPDAQRLAVTFSGLDYSEPHLQGTSGIGTMPVGGGEIKPILLVPESSGGNIPHHPAWSPDGTKIVYSAGSSSVAYDTELWLINADGSGEPLRLTYNHSYDAGVSWWGPAIFTDVPKGNWAYCAISACYLAGIVQGYAGDYRPSDPVTRAQMAVFVARALSGGDAYVPTAPAVATFPDVPIDYWAFRYVEHCAAEGIVQGYWDGYHPEDDVSRAQMAVYIARAIATPTGEAGLADYVPPTTATFPDVPTDYWAYKHIEYLADPSRGIVKGYDTGYRPENIVTRDQMAVYIARAFELPM